MKHFNKLPGFLYSFYAHLTRLPVPRSFLFKSYNLPSTFASRSNNNRRMQHDLSGTHIIRRLRHRCRYIRVKGVSRHSLRLIVIFLVHRVSFRGRVILTVHARVRFRWIRNVRRIFQSFRVFRQVVRLRL